MGKIEYVKLSSGLIPENLYENGQLELLFGNDMGRKISKLPNELKGSKYNNIRPLMFKLLCVYYFGTEKSICPMINMH